jgi:hypothetical protein
MSEEQSVSLTDDDLPEITEEDAAFYRRLVSPDLDPEQRRVILDPPRVYPRQEAVLAIHWHPEHVPMDLIRRRIDATFPDKREELIIPTQHNVLMSYGDLCGVEVDCYSASFRRKVQILFHFTCEKLEGRGDVFKAMLEHTRRYRSTQLFEFIASLLEPELDGRVQDAAEQTGADERLITFVRGHVRKLKEMILRFEDETLPDMFKNKLLRDYFNALRDAHDNKLINHAQLFLRAVKKIVKRHFSLEYFYRTEEFIEEARALGAGVVIPHPEQFWPILLEDYDVDGIEVWNPQSYEYTRFLIEVVNRENKAFRRRRRPLLITMGDDCHLGEKVKDPRFQDPEKAGREVGVQPPWDDLAIRKRLIAANANRRRVIEEYRSRLH